MNRSTIARRYAPLVALAAVQLLIIATVPSTAAKDATALSSTGRQTFDANGNPTNDPGAGGDQTQVTLPDGSIDPTGGTVPGGGPLSTSSGGGPLSTSPGGGPGTTRGPGGGTVPPGPGDTSHCVGGRQFDPAIYFYAPPCVAKFTGSNGGATYQGVTDNSIKVIYYYGKGNDAVDTILKAQGAYVSIDQERVYFAKLADFVNANFEMYGRKMTVEVVQGTCGTIPPQVDCLRAEMRGIAVDKKPFAFLWNTSLCSVCFQELSKVKVINIGGWHFRDTFGAANHPYHYDVQASGTLLSQAFGQFWCKQFTGKPAKYALDKNPLDKINGRTRRLGVISTNDPENQNAVEIDLKAELAKCGASYNQNKYFYAQDISSAAQQVQAGISAMKQNSAADEATSVACFCDLVAAQFLYGGEDNNNYYPENFIPGTGFMDADAASQSYETAAACPKGSPCPFDNAIGVSSLSPQEPKFADAGQRVWNKAGGAGQGPFESMSAYVDYFFMLGSMIQASGPTLNPDNAYAGMVRYGIRGDATHAGHGILNGSHSWTVDERIVLWDKNKASSYNAKPGTYVQVEGGRYRIGGFPGGEFPK